MYDAQIKEFTYAIDDGEYQTIRDIYLNRLSSSTSSSKSYTLN